MNDFLKRYIIFNSENEKLFEVEARNISQALKIGIERDIDAAYAVLKRRMEDE